MSRELDCGVDRFGELPPYPAEASGGADAAWDTHAIDGLAHMQDARTAPCPRQPINTLAGLGQKTLRKFKSAKCITSIRRNKARHMARNAGRPLGCREGACAHEASLDA